MYTVKAELSPWNKFHIFLGLVYVTKMTTTPNIFVNGKISPQQSSMQEIKITVVKRLSERQT